MRDLESSLACIVCLHSLLRDCVGEDMQSTDALYTATVKKAVAHAPIHTAHMHAHKQVHNYACSGSL